MIEYDRNLHTICDLINQCYQELFPTFPQMPEFTFSRLMATLWKMQVYNKLKDNLFSSFKAILRIERRIQGKNTSRPVEAMTDFFDEPKTTSLLSRFIQSIADISINEIKVHMLGSTKFEPDEPYAQLQDIIVVDTKYC